MMASGLRTAFNEHLFEEPDQDANSALLELDKGLRSPKIGEQCEAIARFPKLIEQYPYSILINSAMLKLAEVFSTGTNFPRLCVLKVCQQSEKHLGKIFNVDEFLKRILTVIRSNDPIARSLVLRTLGSMATIIPGRKSVHHTIGDSLDSHDDVELKAAIYAASKFAAQSKTYSVNMFRKITEMIQSLDTPVNIKLKLIPTLQYMHQDAQTAAKVRRLCSQLLLSYPSQDFTCVMLHTLTLLASKTLVEIPQQLLLLLEYLSDSRWAVQVQVLSDLKILSIKSPHLWTTSNVDNLIDQLLEHRSHIEFQKRTLDILVTLAMDETVICFTLNDEARLHLIWNQFCYSCDLSVATKAVHLLVQIVILSSKQNSLSSSVSDLSHFAALAVESLISGLFSAEKVEGRELKIALASAVQLSRVAVSEISSAIVNCLIRLLLQSTDSTLILLCQTFAAIGDTQQSAIVPAVEDIISMLKKLVVQRDQETAVSLLCVSIFQVHITLRWSQQARNVIDEAVCSVNLWIAFRIARSATRYGHHFVAHKILNRMQKRVSTENLSYWIQGMCDFTLAESQLTDQAVLLSRRLESAMNFYLLGLPKLKSVTEPTRALNFQAEFARQRLEFLSSCLQLIQACRTLQLSPPPAIALGVAASTRDPLMRFGRITVQLRRSVVQLRQAAEAMSKLRQSAFDADQESLINLQIQQQMALILAQTIESTCLKTLRQGDLIVEDDFPMISKTMQAAEHVAVRSMASRCTESVELVRRFREANPDLNLINHLNVGCIMDCLKLIIETPLCFPRFMFQSLQTTSIKLAVSPQPKVDEDAVKTTIDSQLAVKVEGIVQVTSRHRSSCRKVRAVQVTIQSNPVYPIGPDGKRSLSSTKMKTTVEPHNDYFSTQFILPFTSSGMQRVVVETALQDTCDALWKCGQSSLKIKVL